MKHVVDNRYRTFGVWYGDFWRVLNLWDTEISISKKSRFLRVSGEVSNYKVWGRNPKYVIQNNVPLLSIRNPTRWVEKSSREFLTYNSNANFGILAFLPMFLSDSNSKSRWIEIYVIRKFSRVFIWYATMSELILRICECFSKFASV